MQITSQHSKNQKRGNDLSELKSSSKLVHFYFAPLVRFYTPIGRELSCTAAYSYLLRKFSTRTAQNCFISTPFPIGTQAICHDKGVSTFSSHTTLLQAVTSFVLSTRQCRTTQQTETLGVQPHIKDRKELLDKLLVHFCMICVWL